MRRKRSQTLSTQLANWQAGLGKSIDLPTSPPTEQLFTYSENPVLRLRATWHALSQSDPGSPMAAAISRTNIADIGTRDGGSHCRRPFIRQYPDLSGFYPPS